MAVSVRSAGTCMTGGSLSYSVDWGDEASSTGAKSKMLVQSSTFTHTYDKAGTYTVMFTVENDAGKSAKTSATVKVTGSTQTGPVISGLVATSSSKDKAVVRWMATRDGGETIPDDVF